MTSHLSTKDIPPEERLIFALDVSDREAARSLVAALGDAVRFYKLGLQLMMSRGYFEIVDDLLSRGKKVFSDVKMFDVPETVAAAMSQLRDSGVTFATVHGNDAMLAAANAEKGAVKILAVTALTSLDRHDLKALGFQADVQELVLSRAKRALELGCDGVISSGLEAPQLRRSLGEKFLIVTPGIRPVDNEVEKDDQKRVSTPLDAFQNGADYIVVGRPIRDAPDPQAAAQKIQLTIHQLFESKPT